MAEGRDKARQLVTSADIFIESLRPGEAAALGLGHEAMRAANPTLIYFSLSAFGQDGPYKNLKAYDGIVNAKSGRMRDQVGWQRLRPTYRAVNDVSYHAAMFATQSFDFTPQLDAKPLPTPLDDPALDWQQALVTGRNSMRQLAAEKHFTIYYEDVLSYNRRAGFYSYVANTSRDIVRDRGQTSVYIVAMLSVTGIVVWWHKRAARVARAVTRSKEDSVAAATS